MAVLPVQSMMNQLSLGIKVVQNLVGVATVTGCKNHDFEFALQKVKNLKCTRSYVDTCLSHLSCWKFYTYFDVVRHHCALVAVDEGLV